MDRRIREACSKGSVPGKGDVWLMWPLNPDKSEALDDWGRFLVGGTEQTVTQVSLTNMYNTINGRDGSSSVNFNRYISNSICYTHSSSIDN